MVKYKEYYQKMIAENQSLFAEFQFIHDLYQANKKANQVVFNEKGIAIRKIIEDWDRKLCGRMERGKNASYSQKLSEKFWNEVRQKLPLIDFVGATIS